MINFMITSLSGVQTWTRGEIRKSTADWNQNNPNADNYIKNRTHWEEKATKEENFMIARELDLSEEGYREWIDIPMLTAGQNYIVNWNGERYECLAKIDSYGETVYLGNPHLGEWYENAPSSEPFFIATFPGQYWSMICCEPGIYTIEILLPAGRTIVHKLDKKFVDIPENLATTDDVEEVWNLADNAYSLASGKINKSNPVGTGSFSMNRKANTTIGDCSHAEGKDTTASGQASHAEGYYTKATNNFTHAEGVNTTASGIYSHAEGSNSSATGSISHSEGLYVIAGSSNQHAQGKYNLLSSDDTLAHIVGNGTSSTERSNAHTLDWEGNAWYSGDVYVGSTSGKNKDSGSKKLATEDSVHDILIATGLITPEDIDTICGVTT